MFQNPNLLTFPDLIIDMIVSYLDAKTLLSLRRVSSRTKEWTSTKRYKNDGEKWKRFEFLITDDEDEEEFETMGNLLKLELPVANITIDNSDKEDKIYDDTTFIEFKRLHASRIRKLTVSKYKGRQSVGERDFFKSLVNLEELIIKEYIIDKPKGKKRIQNGFPTCFKKLKILKITRLIHPRSINWMKNFLNSFSKLEYLAYPSIVVASDNNFAYDGSSPESTDDESVTQWGFSCIRDYIETRERNAPFEPNLKILDLKNLTSRHGGRGFGTFLQNCNVKGIKIRNVLNKLITLDGYQRVNPQDCNNVIKSLKNINADALEISWKTLDEIDIVKSCYSILPYNHAKDCYHSHRPIWLNLKCLKVNWTTDTTGRFGRLSGLSIFGTERHPMHYNNQNLLAADDGLLQAGNNILAVEDDAINEEDAAVEQVVFLENEDAVAENEAIVVVEGNEDPGNGQILPQENNPSVQEEDEDEILDESGIPIWARDGFTPSPSSFLQQAKNAECLARILFIDFQRPNLERLKLEFELDEETKESITPPDIITTAHISNNFPNLKKLEIIQWKVDCNSFPILWKGLSLLEQLTIESCSNLEDAGFIGDDPKEPAFLKLTNLKILTLAVNYEDMPGVSDKVFKHVIRHIKLKEFHLESENPLEHLTMEGLKSLLNGDFNKSIEKFPFDVLWSLESGDCDSNDLKELGKQFRSIL